MRRQRLGTLPSFEDDEGLRAELGLERAYSLRVDMGDIFDTPFLLTHGRSVGLEGSQNLVPTAGLGGENGDDTNYLFLSDGPSTGLWLGATSRRFPIPLRFYKVKDPPRP